MIDKTTNKKKCSIKSNDLAKTMKFLSIRKQKFYRQEQHSSLFSSVKEICEQAGGQQEALTALISNFELNQVKIPCRDNRRL